MSEDFFLKRIIGLRESGLILACLEFITINSIYDILIYREDPEVFTLKTLVHPFVY